MRTREKRGEVAGQGQKLAGEKARRSLIWAWGNDWLRLGRANFEVFPDRRLRPVPGCSANFRAPAKYTVTAATPPALRMVVPRRRLPSVPPFPAPVAVPTLIIPCHHAPGTQDPRSTAPKLPAQRRMQVQTQARHGKALKNERAHASQLYRLLFFMDRVFACRIEPAAVVTPLRPSAS